MQVKTNADGEYELRGVPENEAESSPESYPHFVDRAMIDAVRTTADVYVECVTSQGLPQDLRVDGRTVLYRPSGQPIDENREFPSPEMHAAAVQSLEPVITRIMGR